MEKWHRQEDESAEQYKAFTIYLLMTRRNESDCAKMIQKSESTVRRWAARYEWRRRAAAYDENLIDETRAAVKRRLAETMTARFEQVQRLADLAAEQLETKIATASARTASESFYSACDMELKLAEKLKVFEPSADASDKDLTIKIIDATGDNSAENPVSPENRPSE